MSSQIDKELVIKVLELLQKNIVETLNEMFRAAIEMIRMH